MDKFVIGRVVTVIDYSSMQFSIRLAAATVVALLAKSQCSHAAKGMPSKSIRTALTMRLNVFGFHRGSAEAPGALTCPLPIYCAFTHVSDPVSFTATSVKKIRSGLPSPVPRWSKETDRGPTFL